MEQRGCAGRRGRIVGYYARTSGDPALDPSYRRRLGDVEQAECGEAQSVGEWLKRERRKHQPLSHDLIDDDSRGVVCSPVSRS